MTTYVTRQIKLAVAEQQNFTDKLIDRGGVDVRYSAIDGLAEAELVKYALSIPVADSDLMEGSSISEGRILYLETDTEVRVKLSADTDTGFIVKPIEAGNRGALYLEGSFTHVYLTTIGTSGTATIVAGIVGA